MERTHLFTYGRRLGECQFLPTHLFVAKRKAEQRLKDDHDFYIVSLSHKVIAYKGLIMPQDLMTFYPDLADETMATSICLFHQRFSTNTSPRWPLAQPFRMLAHNGEINTIQGNRNWANARVHQCHTNDLPEIASLTPLVNSDGSDSSSMDNMLELLVTGGVDLYRAVRMMVPPAWQNIESMDASLRAFYEYNSLNAESWDGPAGIVLTDGDVALCMLDRNGLRPARYVVTKQGFISVSSEVVSGQYAPEDVVTKGRIGPGQLMAIDTVKGTVSFTDDIDTQLKNAYDYDQWMQRNVIRIESLIKEPLSVLEEPLANEQLQMAMKLHHVTFEEREQVLRPLAELGQEAVGSMGDDTPMAVLSSQQRSLYDYFRQQFAQVTNPPIDPIRESIVMSLETSFGVEANPFEAEPSEQPKIIINSPVLSRRKYRRLTDGSLPLSSKMLSLAYGHLGQSLRQALESLVHEAVTSITQGAVILVLSDRDVQPGQLLIPAVMATGAVHHALNREGLRCCANIIVETGSARDSHQMAVLLGFGATAIYPYLSYRILNDMIAQKEIIGDPHRLFKNYRAGLVKGLLKILSKMGISMVSSYRGAQLFEIIGLSKAVVDYCFTGAASRIEGACFSDIEHDQAQLAEYAWKAHKPISAGGLLKYVHGKEYHAFNPDVVHQLQQAVKTGDYQQYKVYADTVNKRPPATLRDLLALQTDGVSIPIEQVQSEASILQCFDSAGMSLGALSPEAHEALATAMNRLGARSNSGEGGEDPARYGTEKVSKIKQVASGRFGVTPAYLVNAEVLQIKIAQGAKPGEGGQLPGGKVNTLIARLRYSVPGVTLISPPPHHDIYSIEDLAQLIFDLKQVNPEALVSVKLVAEVGVGTIATGVAKAYADLITVSGYDGGTAASPLTSIHHAGIPFELGISEVHQALRVNHLRDKVRLQTDGGLKTGLDVIKAAILGAESFGFGTAPMIALGCKYLRICHLNNCATGVATQDERLRDEHFIGTVEMVMHFFRFIAQDVREHLALLGVPDLKALIGRVDLLKQLEGTTDKHAKLDFNALLKNDFIAADEPQFCTGQRNKPHDKGQLAERMVQDIMPAIEAKQGGLFNYNVTNCDRSIGARLSGEIAKRYGNHGMKNNPVTLHLTGTAGQSFGVWNAGGLRMVLEGDANDYVGKGMTGGELVIYPPKRSTFASNEVAIIGNTCLYGATGGTLFASGTAGERFGVRNSGAVAVVEGVGDHCCEYMTGGVVVVLGDVGYNFGAGMTGGFAFVFDQANDFNDKCNHELVETSRIIGERFGAHREYLKTLLHAFVESTHSQWGQSLLDDFTHHLNKFRLVKPKAASIESLLDNSRAA